uniref:S-adenosylmethionine:tRNA ribosyltransferase-isomerase n=1 Tax=Heterorhabditis bacteriophora TaxID=37862 RepID=A0A1I7XKY6_HETBA
MPSRLSLDTDPEIVFHGEPLKTEIKKELSVDVGKHYYTETRKRNLLFHRVDALVTTCSFRGIQVQERCSSVLLQC